MGAELSEQKLTMWLKNGFNVLLKGRHGTGKTARIVQIFESMGWKLNEDYLYFSAATMDPWCDFVGVPREVTEAGTGLVHLQYVRPLSIQKGKVKAIFFDEFNRAPKKVRNAVMELMQFKSVNGLRFPELKAVWAAVNPDDDENDQYDVEPLDPAQQDRFHVQVDIPYTCSIGFFRKEFGPDMAKGAVQWWQELTDEVKRKVSPRRVEYALKMYNTGGDLEDVLPKEANIQKLKQNISNGPEVDKLRTLFGSKDIEGARNFLAVENQYSACVREIQQNPRYMEFFLPLINDEKIATLIDNQPKVRRHVLMNPKQFAGILETIADANQNQQLSLKIRRALERMEGGKKTFTDEDLDAATVNTLGTKPFGKAGKSDGKYAKALTAIEANRAVANTAYEKRQAFDEIRRNIPTGMSKDEAEKTLKMLSIIADNSYEKTMSKLPNLDGIINNCVKTLVDGGMKLSEIAKDYPKLMEWALDQPTFYFTAIASKTNGGGLDEDEAGE